MRLKSRRLIKNCTIYAAIRECKPDGYLWADYSTISGSAAQVADKVESTRNAIPHWHVDNPVFEIAKFKLVRIVE